MEVSSHTAVDHAITGAHLVAVFWQDMYHSGSDPDPMEGVVHCNGLAGIQGCKRFASFACLWLGGIGVGINSFMNLKGCWIGISNSGRNGGPNLALVQELSRWWELGVDGCSSGCQKGELWVGTTVLSTLECMLHRFYICLGKSIQLWVVRAWGLLCDTPRGAELQWIVHLHTEAHCQNGVLWEFHALRTSLWAVRWLWQCCSGQMEDVRWGSSLNRSCHKSGSQFLLR